MGDSNFEETGNSTIEMAGVVHLVRKVIQFGFSEVVVKVRDGEIVRLEERLYPGSKFPAIEFSGLKNMIELYTSLLFYHKLARK